MSLPLDFSAGEARQFERAVGCEWLETNGLGGWASGTIAGVHTRRYHGLLVAAMDPPGRRMMLLPKLEETLLLGPHSYELGCNEYPGTVAPCGVQYVEQFSLLPFPTWRYRTGPLVLEKLVGAVQGENTTIIRYKLTEAPGPVELLLRPLVAVRDYHSLQHANGAINRNAPFADGVLSIHAYENTPSFHINVPGARFDHIPNWYYRFQYREEQARGLDFEEDLFNYGLLRVQLAPGQTLHVTVSTNPPGGRDPADALAAEASRREQVVAASGFTGEVERQLARAADQFLVRRGENSRAIIAGYHWFGDWGRDTMISIPGLCLATKRHAEARELLRAAARSASEGMLPNCAPDSGGSPAYNTVDAALWFFVAARAYLAATRDEAFVRGELLPVLEEIFEWYDKGTRYNIHCDHDGLLYAGQFDVQLTWMDAKVGNWVVTPRTGKAVEINALWYNAISILGELRGRFGQPGAEDLGARAVAVKGAFAEHFWYADGGYLYDVLNGDDRDTSLRPNQIFALSLPHELLPRDKALAVLKTVEQKLLTPVGLRSLGPNEPGYRPHYEGDVHSRDGSYHQGTVWGWLLGPYITALVRLRGAAGIARAKSIVENLGPRLGQYGLGTLAEIYDAEPPFRPRGCIAQAWSVAEILRVRREDLS